MLVGPASFDLRDLLIVPPLCGGNGRATLIH